MFDIVRFLNENNIEYKQANENWININCPFCDDTKFHGGINNGGYFNCWKCGGHSLKSLIKTILNITYSKADEVITKYSIEFQIRKVLNKKITDKNQQNIILPGESITKIHRKYLIKRGYDPDFIVNKYNILGTTYHIEYDYRIIIPVYHEKKLVSFITRDVTENQPLRYKVPKDDQININHKKTLYGLEFCKKNVVGVVEGVFDQWKMGNNFVATYGTGLTLYQIKQLSKFEKIFFLFDSEPYTQEKAKKYAKQLNILGCETEIIDLQLGDKDPGDLTQKQAFEIKKEILGI